MFVFLESWEEKSDRCEEILMLHSILASKQSDRQFNQQEVQKFRYMTRYRRRVLRQQQQEDSNLKHTVRKISFLRTYCPLFQKNQIDSEECSDGSHEPEEKEFEFWSKNDTPRGFGSSQMVCQTIKIQSLIMICQNGVISESENDSVIAVCDTESVSEFYSSLFCSC